LTGIDVFNTAFDMQAERVLFYDIVVTLSVKAEDEEKKAFYDLLEGNEYTSVYMTGAIIESDDRQTMAGVVCIEDQKVFNEFFATKDDKGRQVDVPEDGVLVTIEMSEKDKLSNNSALRLITSDLNISDLVVKGNYLKYFDKTIITTRKYYEENVAEIDSDNTYLVRARTTTKEELQKKFQSLDIVQSVSRTDTLREDYKDILGLYDAIIVVLLALSILLMFMVLLNLSNILVLHRMKELLTMRVNGFGNGQVLGYLARETIVTTGMGLLLGIVFGVMFVGYMVKQLEAAGVFFYREPYVLGWILSVAISSLFALIINSIAFKKIWDVPLTDITKY
jgi:putative ABC transport system permease protein